MASGFLPEPGKVVDGEEIGPCKDGCEHKDCLETLRQAATECFYCLRPIGFETAFVNHDVTGDGAMRLCHTPCVQKILRDGRLG